MSKSDPSLLFIDPEKNGPFVIREKPDFAALPVSDTMSRLKAFLPMMQKANEELALRVQTDPNFEGIEIVTNEKSGDEQDYNGSEDEESYEQDEEEVSASQAKVIQMDLMLVPDMSDSDEEEKVFDQSQTSDAKDERDDDDEEDLLDEEGNPVPEIVRQVRSAQRRQKPRIEEVAPQGE